MHIDHGIFCSTRKRALRHIVTHWLTSATIYVHIISADVTVLLSTVLPVIAGLLCDADVN